MNRTRSILLLPTPRSAFVLALLAATCRGGAAQDAAAPNGLRNTLGGSTTLAASAPLGGTNGVTTATSPALGATGLANSVGSPSTLPASVGAPAVTTNGQRPRRVAVRRNRQPTAAPVRMQLRPSVAPSLTAEVQPRLTGLPDIPVETPAPRRRQVAEDPFAQLGIRSGGVTFYPSIGESIGYDSNPNRANGAKRGSFVSQTEGEVRLQSDWSTHELTGYLRGAYNEYPGVQVASRPEGTGRIGLRLDVSRDTQVNLEGHYQIDTQRPDSPDLNASVRTRPIVVTEGASVGVTQRFNRLLGTIQASVDRSDFEDARLSNGTLFDQSDRNLTQIGIRGRLGYELKPGLVPFVEGLANERIYDRKTDDSGFQRSSDGIGGRIGTTFEITRLISGEIAGGVINRRYDDPRLRDLTAPLVDASLTYLMSPLTTIRASAQVTTDETTVPNATGVIVSRGTLEVSHDFRRYLNVTAGITGTNYDYKGSFISEQSFGGTLKAEYKLSRSVAVRASYGYERLWSNVPNSSYSANTFLVGMRYQP